jgi:hypothetical protein
MSISKVGKQRHVGSILLGSRREDMPLGSSTLTTLPTGNHSIFSATVDYLLTDFLPKTL